LQLFVEQMEGAAVAAACRAMGIEEYIHLRAISNYVDDARSAWRIKEAVKALGERIAELNL
jgi:nucleoside phosphorylase